MKAALAQAKVRPLLIDYDDREFPQAGEPLAALDYEAFLAAGDAISSGACRRTSGSR
jgi:fatty-acyl-CoA synthase